MYPGCQICGKPAKTVDSEYCQGTYCDGKQREYPSIKKPHTRKKLTLHKKYKDANELQANLQKFWQSIPREKRNKFYQDVEEIDDTEETMDLMKETITERKSNA